MQHWLAKENVNAECSTIEINFVHAQQKTHGGGRERENVFMCNNSTNTFGQKICFTC